MLFTGSIVPGRPTLGAWSLYGLGSESKNLPGFVVMAAASSAVSAPTTISQRHVEPPSSTLMLPLAFSAL